MAKGKEDTTLPQKYYEGMKVFWDHTNQFQQVQRLMETYLHHFRDQLSRSLQSNSITDELRDKLTPLLNKPLNWLDLGSGNGEMTAKILDSLENKGYPCPKYEGVEPDAVFVEMSKDVLNGRKDITITKADAFSGNLPEYGQRNFITALNSVYFVKDFNKFKQEVDKILDPNGVAIFVQSRNFTEKLKGPFNCQNDIGTPVEVFFPNLPDAAWDLLTNKKSEADIIASASLDEKQKEDTITTKKILEAMSNGASTEEEAGQKVAQMYRERIFGNDFGGVGRHVVDNVMLAYIHPNASFVLKEVAAKATELTRQELGTQITR
jgi:SAM-dependent methyltransferase